MKEQTVTKEQILERVTKQNNVNHLFLKEHCITAQACYDICFGPGTCCYCGNLPKFISWSKGYKVTCDTSVCKKRKRSELTKATNMKLYGVENISQLPEIKERKLESSKKTNMERYNVENVFSSKEIMYKDGVHVTQTPVVNDRRRKTMFENHGVEYPGQMNGGFNNGMIACHTPEVEAKVRETCNELYGGDTSFSSKEVQQRIVDDRIKEYGVSNVMDIPEVKEKHTAACIERDIKRMNDIDENGLN